MIILPTGLMTTSLEKSVRLLRLYEHGKISSSSQPTRALLLLSWAASNTSMKP
jgi:hypothetical protein